MPKVSPARFVAFESFVDVMEKQSKPEDCLDKYSQLYLSKDEKARRLDRSLAKEILFGSLRWYKKILWILQHTASRDLGKLSPQVRSALVLGTYQIFYMDKIPERAAVNESVEYIKEKKDHGAVGFVNGILRQIARRAEYFTKPDKKKNPVEYLALQFSHPDWLVERWLERFGFEKMENLLQTNNQPPPLFIRQNSLKIPLVQSKEFQDLLLKQEHMNSERTSLKGCFTLDKFPRVGTESLFDAGFYTIQDQASQLIPLLINYVDSKKIVDAASGPGGKLCHIAELASPTTEIIACELSPSQMARSKDNAQRLGVLNRIQWVDGDFLSTDSNVSTDSTVHMANACSVLLDSPCTGLGVLRRHPEGKWHKQLGGIKEMQELQRKLIVQGLDLLRVGGEMIYSVCSFEPEESETHLKWIMDKYGAKFELVSPVSRLPDYFKRYVTKSNILMIYAGNEDQMDGFAAFIVRRIS